MDTNIPRSIVVVAFMVFIHLADGYTNTDLSVKVGAPLTFELPNYKSCGQFTLLNPFISPVVVIEGSDSLSIIGRYIDRTVTDQTDQGFNLTILNASKSDAGSYKIASPKRNNANCTDVWFSVTVKDSSDEYLQSWSWWTACGKLCDPYQERTRMRNCSMPNGCKGMGQLKETESCDQNLECPHWTEWAPWGTCSAKCGKGFKVRKRACLNGNSSLLKSSECDGISTQSHMCMTVCELIGHWSIWSSWSNCSQPCDGGTRNRSRACVDNDKYAELNCSGTGFEDENCNTFVCEDTVSVTPIDNSVDSTDETPETESEPLDLIVVVVLVGVLLIVVVVIVGLLCKRHKQRSNARQGLPPRKDTPPKQQRAKKISTTSKKDAKRHSKSEPGNVYSEMSSNSNFCYASSEFDAVDGCYDIDASTGRPSNAAATLAAAANFATIVAIRETVDELIDDVDEDDGSADVLDSDFDDDDNDNVNNDVNENLELNNAVNAQHGNPTDVQKVETNLDWIYNFDPEDDIYDNNTCTPDVPEVIIESKDTIKAENSLSRSKEEEANADKETIEENIYENCDILNEQIHDSLENVKYDTKGFPYKKTKQESHIPIEPVKDSAHLGTSTKKKKSIKKLTSIFKKKSESELDAKKKDGEHTYVNDNISPDMDDFYVVPKSPKRPIHNESEHIYDTPRFSKMTD